MRAHRRRPAPSPEPIRHSLACSPERPEEMCEWCRTILLDVIAHPSDETGPSASPLPAPDAISLRDDADCPENVLGQMGALPDDSVPEGFERFRFVEVTR
jgi:hypothetical protein